MSRSTRSARTVLLVLCAICLPLVAACSREKIVTVLIPNQGPTVELTQVPAPADTLGTYVYEVSWAGFDPDGRVMGFRYALDAPTAANAETAWVATTSNRETFVFRADSTMGPGAVRARGFHTFVIQAIDDRGARSALAHVSFTRSTVAPTVAFVTPHPNALLQPEVAPSVRMTFRGDDPDGVDGDRKPRSYRYRLFTESDEIPLVSILVDGDSLRRRYAPAFAGWDSLPGTATSVELHGLTPRQSYVLAIVAIDAAGAYSPVFSLNENLLWFRVANSATLGPRLTLRSSTFEYTYPSGGFFLDRESWIHAEFAAGVPIPIEWSAVTPAGTFVRGYRWAVDLSSLDDETPRSDEANDLSHWSQTTLQNSVTLPRFDPPTGQGVDSHTFYLKAEDDLGNISLAVVAFNVVKPIFDRELLVVDDTWLTPDRVGTGGCVASPPGTWPSAAELDTFLFAVGDKPWKCYPTGTRSAPGLFAGYAFDTLSTHLATPDQLSLRSLSRYRNILWLTDPTSALSYESSANSTLRPMPRLREWCSPNVQNPLLVWMQQGGRLWLMGGGAALASLRPYDKAGTSISVYSSSLGELGPGRLMYDAARWRSEITMARSTSARRSSRAVADDGNVPDYSVLPATLDAKQIETDPLPPQRPGAVHATIYTAEFLSLPNPVYEVADGAVFAALDTLYETGGGDAGVGRPVMTYYHGR
ncbi:MAG: hypothetical protein RL219_1905, partial [Actinomycetota bacterium]